MHIAAVRRARHDAAWCGDVTAWWQDGPRTTLFIADGLGHGEPAEEAARTAADYVQANRSQPLPAIFCGCDAALRDTRGVAMAVAVLDEIVGTITYIGIGNTRGRLLGKQTVCFYSHPGIVGGRFQKPSVMTKPIHPGDSVLMWTDGIAESINLSFIEHLANRRGLPPDPRAAQLLELGKIEGGWGRAFEPPESAPTGGYAPKTPLGPCRLYTSLHNFGTDFAPAGLSGNGLPILQGANRCAKESPRNFEGLIWGTSV